MKVIIYTWIDGGVNVFRPASGNRLATAIKDSTTGEIISRSEFPMSVEKFTRGWPIPGLDAEWAETEEEQVTRLSQLTSVVPIGTTDVQIVDDSTLPTDRMFRKAWKNDKGNVDLDLDKCKLIAHEYRRVSRDLEFAPYDKIIALQIPGKASADAEAARVTIREKYANNQIAIDSASTLNEIKQALI